MEKTVLITGGSRGIGAALVDTFAKKGYRVAFSYQSNQQIAHQIVENLTAQSCAVQAFRADVADWEQVQWLVQQTEDAFGKVDILVNNAGIAQQKLFTDITPEEWRRMLGVHLDGTFYCCKAVLPGMISRKWGRIINISSMWGQVGASCEVHYSAAKAGIIGLTKALAQEEGPSGITVNCIAPGVIETDMMAGFSQEDKRELADQTPVCRLGTPQEIADAALFLAADNAGFITGQVLGVNGGMVV